MAGKLILEVTFTVDFCGESFVWGQGYVNIQAGKSELLLDHRPSFWTGTEIVINGEEIKQLEISKDRVIQVKGVEQKLTFTKIALLKLEQEYKKYIESNSNFKGIHSIHSFGGWLKDVNRRIFQKKFADFRCTLDHNESLKQAYLSTPFGKARSELGISEFQLEIPSWKKLIDLIELEDWHENNKPGTGRDIQYLRDNEVSDSQWDLISVPDRIIATGVRRPTMSDLDCNIEWLI